MHSRRIQKPSPSSNSTNSSYSFLRSATSCTSTVGLLCFLNLFAPHVLQSRVNRIRNPTHRVGVRLGQPLDEVPIAPHPKAGLLDVPRHTMHTHKKFSNAPHSPQKPPMYTP